MTIKKVGAIIWTSKNWEKLLEFYRAIGIPLADDEHDEPGGPTHFECDVAGTHFAIFPDTGEAVLHATSESPTMVGLEVDDIDAVVAAIAKIGARIRTPLEDSPWGRRIVVFDPDGRRVELYQPNEEVSEE